MRLKALLLVPAAFAAHAWLAAPAAAEGAADELARIVELWLGSGHGDHGSLSFTYWNEEGAIPPACAACHSGPAFVDWLGADGSAFSIVDHPAPINATVDCAACHTSAAHALSAVAFPSGVTVEGLGPNAVCTVCHQGRQSNDSVAAATAGLPEDTVSEDLAFLNIHYGIAAAVTHGAEVRAGFHYPGKTYQGRFAHVPGADTCVACHDPHSSAVATDGCLACHRGVDDIRAIRTRHGDFDGDGDQSGGIHAEILGLQAHLYTAIRTYAREVAGAPIVYAPGTFPYFFHDTDEDGQPGEGEAIFPNRYQSWTPRLLKAAYNYQVARKDPGGYVHNPTYLMQLLHDSLEDLSDRIEIDMPTVIRP